MWFKHIKIQQQYDEIIVYNVNDNSNIFKFQTIYNCYDIDVTKYMIIFDFKLTISKNMIFDSLCTSSNYVMFIIY